MEIWECILKSTLTPAQKLDLIKNSQAVSILVDISEITHVKFLTERKTRNGNMAFAVKLANLLKTQKDSEPFSTLPELNDVFDHKWISFVDGELASSNELNNRSLGGRQRSNTDEDDDPAS
jgi:hypothetical protein